jgi:hypothetical protein
VYEKDEYAMLKIWLLRLIQMAKKEKLKKDKRCKKFL